MIQEFLNEEARQFQNCTREQQHILLDAVLDGKAEYFRLALQTWEQSDTRTPIQGVIYRTKPIKRLAIPWEHIKPEYKFAAMDETEEVIVYRFKPVLSKYEWKHADSDQDAAYLSLNALNIDTSDISWRDSLVERPADK